MKLRDMEKDAGNPALHAIHLPPWDSPAGKDNMVGWYGVLIGPRKTLHPLTDRWLRRMEEDRENVVVWYQRDWAVGQTVRLAVRVKDAEGRWTKAARAVAKNIKTTRDEPEDVEAS